MVGRRVRFLLSIPVSIVLLMAYTRAQPERHHIGKKNCRKSRRGSRKKWIDKIVARRDRLGRNHAAQDDRGRKDWPAALHHVSRKFDGTDTGGIPANHARCDRSPRRRLHQYYAWFAAGIVKSQAYPTAVLNNQLQAKSKLPLLIGADFERGTAMRLDEGTSFPTAMALAAGGNLKDAYTMGKITAREARAVGVHWIYAPDADVTIIPEIRLSTRVPLAKIRSALRNL